MSGQVLGYGIDFGSTNSLISIAYPDRVDVQRLSDSSGSSGLSCCMPSVVYFDRDSDFRAGQDAIEQFGFIAGHKTICNKCEHRGACDPNADDDKHHPKGTPKKALITACYDARLAYGLKSFMADHYEGTTTWGRHFTLEEMTSWILRDLKRAADGRPGKSSLPVVIGIPVRYEYEESRAKAKQRMKTAARDAGFTNVSFLEEPKAALTMDLFNPTKSAGKKGAYVAVDFGGGTFDVAVSKTGASPWAANATAGVAVGGELFDSRLFTSLAAPKMNVADLVAKNPWLKTRSGMLMAAGRSEQRALLSGILTEIFDRGQVYEFWKAIEAAKVELSKSTKATIDFHKRGISIDVPITRQEFERLIAADMEKVRGAIREALSKAKVAGKDVVLVVKTGGSSALPCFATMLAEEFPNAVVESQPALTTIAEGLGHYVRVQNGIDGSGSSTVVAPKPVQPSPASGKKATSTKTARKSRKPTAPKAGARNSDAAKTKAAAGIHEVGEKVVKKAAEKSMDEVGKEIVTSLPEVLTEHAEEPSPAKPPSTSEAAATATGEVGRHALSAESSAQQVEGTEAAADRSLLRRILRRISGK